MEESEEEDSCSLTPNGVIVATGPDAPKPLQRSRLQRPGELEPGRPSSENRATVEPCAEVDVGKLVSRLQEGGAKLSGKSANSAVPTPNSPKASSLHIKRPAPRPGAGCKEGEYESFTKVRLPGEKPVITRPPMRPPDPPCKAPVPQKAEPKADPVVGTAADAPSSVVASRAKFFETASFRRGGSSCPQGRFPNEEG